MEIKPPSTDIYTAITRGVTSDIQNQLPGSTPPSWKVEQLLQAVIIKMTDKQLFLDIQGIKSHTPKPNFTDFQVGDTLKLQIEQLKPMPQFRILGLEKAVNTHVLSQALKQVTAQNTEIAPLFKNISFVANRPALRPSPLAADVNAMVREIFKQIPSPFNLKTAAQVRNQLNNSGLFIESKIKNQIISVLQHAAINKPTTIRAQLNSNIKSELSLDLGAQLHRLAGLIKTQIGPVMTQNTNLMLNQNTTPHTTQSQNANVTSQSARSPIEQASLLNVAQREEAMQTFLRQVESSLNHMHQTQFQNLNESQAGRPLWLMELPIKDGQDIDLFELRISEEENSNQDEGEAKKVWNITLKFDLTGIGKIKAHIKMQNNYISAQFFSDKKEVLSLFQENFDFLRSRLNSNGLNVGNIECAHAKLSDEKTPIHSKPLDIRT